MDRLHDGVRVVEGRSQTAVRANYPPRLDPKTLPFYVPPRDQGALLLAAASEAGKAEGGDI